MNKEKNIVKQSERNIPMLHRVHILTYWGLKLFMM